MDVFFIEKISLSVVNITTLLLVLVIFFANRRAYTNIFYVITALSILAWVDFGFLVYYISDINMITLYARLNFASVVVFCVSAYYLGLHFPTSPESKARSFINYIFTLIGIVLASISAFSPLIISSIELSGNNRVWQEGILGTFFYFYVIVTAVLFFYNIVKKYLHGTDDEKSKIVSFIYGVIIFLALNIIFNIAYPYIFNNDQYYWIGDYSVIFFLGFTAYGIVKHGLFNIKVIATQTTVVALSVALLIETIASNDLTEGATKAIIWIIATYGGYVLIKSVKQEIRQREEIQQLAKKLDEANQHLEELDEAKDNFLSMAAHELNTPIAAIEGYLSMIVDEKMCGELNEKLENYLKNIYGSSKRLATLVKDLLNVSRIESNRIHLLYEETQIEQLIESSIAEVKIKADEVGHKLIFEKPAGHLPKTWLDKDRITEVVINILGNSIKYTEPPGKIIVKAHADDGKIVVAIEDNGRGIPKDRQDHIFEKFAQGDVLKDQVKGTGLGMFITKNLIELHKGKVWFESSTDQHDHGTTFYFSIPILTKKPFDPHEGEGALFATKQKPSDNASGSSPKSQALNPKHLPNIEATKNQDAKDTPTSAPTIDSKDSEKIKTATK